MDSGVKFGITGHALLALGASGYYLMTMFQFVKIDVSFSVIALIFFAISFIVNLSSLFLTSNPKLRSYYLYFLVFQVALCISFAIIVSRTVKKENVANSILEEPLKKFLKGDKAEFIRVMTVKIKFFLKKAYKQIYVVVSKMMQNEQQQSCTFTKIRNVTKTIEDPTDDELKEFLNSCCSEVPEGQICTPDGDKYYKTKCFDALEKAANKYKDISIFIFVLSAIYQCFLFFSFKNAQSEI